MNYHYARFGGLILETIVRLASLLPRVRRLIPFKTDIMLHRRGGRPL